MTVLCVASLKPEDDRFEVRRQLARSNMTVPPSDRGTTCSSVSDSVDPQ